MENSGTVLFEDDTAEWYVAMGEKWMGPLAAADIYAKILNQELNWAHFVWRQGEIEWKRVCDTKTFQVAVPSAPKSKPDPVPARAKSAKVAPPPMPDDEARSWFLFYNATQFGPFSEDEIGRAITSGKIHGRVHAWKEGLAGWERLEKLTQFGAALAQVATAKQGSRVRPPAAGPVGEDTQTRLQREQRETPRAPLLAKIILAPHPPSVGSSGSQAGKESSPVTVAMCRDISIGGMQVLTDKIPGAVGSRIKMNVSATSNLEPFVAEGVIVRILEDKRGFSFRFEKLSDSAKRSIEGYITSNAG